MTEATEAAEAVETKPKKPAAEQRNGVTKPGGKITGRVWEICDEISRQTGRPALREEVMAAGEAEGISRGTLATQYSRWTTFYDVSKEQRADARAATRPPKASKKEDAVEDGSIDEGEAGEDTSEE